jgi:hypothetical protein
MTIRKPLVLNSGQIQQLQSGDTLDVFPTGSIYIQVASAASNTDATALPSSESPATLFGGTWTEMWDDEAIALITQGDYHASEGQNSGRTNGLQVDQFQSWQGGVYKNSKWYYGAPTGSTERYHTVNNAANYSECQFNTGQQGDSMRLRAVNDGTHGDIREGYATRPKNRLMIIWKRTA